MKVRALTADELLAAWEHAQGRPPSDRALTLLAAACDVQRREQLEALSIGRRDAMLMDVREHTFGADLAALARCPRCGERVELAFCLDAVRVETGPGSDEPFHVTADGYQLTARLPDSRDLTVVAGEADPSRARAILLERCVLEATRDGVAVSAGNLPAAVVAAVAGRMADHDAQADVRLSLDCPACVHSWEAIFDIASFLWQEVSAWAQRTLRDVHDLARAYGWREADILRMSPQRRQLYLGMVHR